MKLAVSKHPDGERMIAREDVVSTREGSGNDTDVRRWTALAALRFAFSTMPTMLIVTMGSGIILLYLLRDVRSDQALLIWFAGLTAASAVRCVHYLRFRALADDLIDPVVWRYRFRIGAGLSGIAWGSAGGVLFPPGSLFHQVAIAFVLAGLSAGAMTAYSAIPRAYFFFVLPVTLPLLARFVVEGGEIHYSMAALTVLFMGVVIRSSIESSRLVGRVFETQAKNMDLTRALHHRATHDSLVNLVNHGEFKLRLEALAARAAVNREPYALLFVDLDKFKLVNDASGHAAGDELLRQVAGILEGHIRTDDTAARVGGDEFGLLLQGCSRDVAAEIAMSILNSIQELRFVWEGRCHEIGASIGVAYAVAGEHDAQTILRAADAACYAAKKSGRGRIEIYHSDPKYVSSGRFDLDALRIQDTATAASTLRRAPNAAT